ncbi:MAG: hypothetical protein WCH98_22940, partial [Verrucomicrobiota bacterium]
TDETGESRNAQDRERARRRPKSSGFGSGYAQKTESRKNGGNEGNGQGFEKKTPLSRRACNGIA